MEIAFIQKQKILLNFVIDLLKKNMAAKKKNTWPEGPFINPFTDFGFKKLFGSEPNKDLLIDFLNELLRQHHVQISDLSYKRTEHLGNTAQDRKAIYDLYCENEHGEKFIVELQKAEQKFFKDRTVFYSTFPIQEQAIKGEWDYELKAVYAVAILDFAFRDEDKDETVLSHVKLLDVNTHKVFYHKLTYVYVQMENFTKNIDDLETHLDKWLYVLKHLDKFERIPEHIREKVFEKVFQIARYDNLSRIEQEAYESSIKYYRDMKNSFDTAFEKGKNASIKLLMEAESKTKQAENKAKQAENKAKKAENLARKAKVKAEQERKDKKEAETKAKKAVVKAKLAESKAMQAESKVKEAEAKVEQERNEKIEAMQKLAAKMKRYGEPVDEIIKETGLSREEIEKL
jgi:predicted transposase/invertase (TIGR01784 family)